MKRNAYILLVLLFFTLSFQANAQNEIWSLNKCIEYALTQNIDMQKGQISIDESRINTKQAKAQWQPSLSFSTSHSINNSPWIPEGLERSNTSYNGNYNLSAGWTVFNGFKRKYNIKQQELQEEISLVNMEEIEEDVKLAVLTDYIQILYATENLKSTRNSMEVAEAEYSRSKALFEAGAISKSDFSQIEAQYIKEKHLLVMAENDLVEAKLNLKLLLRLDPNTEMDIVAPEITNEDILGQLPGKDSIFENAMKARPDIKNAELNEQMSELKIKSAKAGYYPSINLNAGVSTGHNSSSDWAFKEQMKQNFGENVGLSLNYSILDNRNRKSEVERAKLNQHSSSLQTEQIKDNLKKTIESAYNDAIAAQLSYVASYSNEKAAEASYELTKEKYDLGAKNPYEMLNGKNALLNAQQQTLQAKYTALLNIQVLNIYQGLPITIE